MTIDRVDSKVAEKCLCTIYPDEAERLDCLQFFAEATRASHAHGAGKWGVTLFKRRVRLTVGKCLALELRKGHVRLGLAPTRLPEDLKRRLDEASEWSDEFATFPLTALCEMPVDSFRELRATLTPHFTDFLRIAAETARQVPTARSHSPGVLAYLETLLGSQLPKAEYQSRGSEFQLGDDDDEPADERAIAVQAPQILFEKVDYSLDNLLTYIETGDIGLPDIQRPFVWSWSKVRDLLDSMYRGYPVGYLLFWANADVQGARQIGSGAKTHKVPNMLVVDGQQRLTSLYAVFRGRAVIDEEFQERKIEIAFRPRDSRFEVADAAIKRDPEYIANVSELWSSNKPVHRIIREFLARLEEKKGLDPADEDAISHNIDRLFDLRKYPFTGLRIMPMVEEEAVASIFVRINSEGVKLNQADFILTLLSVFWEEGRAALEQFSRDSRTPAIGGKPSPFNHFINPSPDQLLRVSVALAFHRAKLKAVYQVLRGKDPVNGGYSPELRDRQFDRLREAQAHVLDLTHWDRFLSALVGAGFRGDEMLSSDTAVLYSYALYLIGRLQCGVGDRELQLAISRWFFMAALSGRYSNSPESIMEEDLSRLRDVRDAKGFVDTLDRIIASTFTSDFWTITLPNDLETSSSRSPALLGYFAALNRLGAPVLFSRKRVSELLDPAVRGRKKSLEKHHLFPKAFLERKGIEDTKSVNQVANYALLEWPENINIADAPPTDYVPEMRKLFGESEWSRMCLLHALPSEWEKMQYEQFLVARRGLMADVIRRGFESIAGEVEGAEVAVDGTAEERKAWELIEKVELTLRSVIRRKFAEKWAAGADERLRKALGDDAWKKIEENRARGSYRLTPTDAARTAEVLDFCFLGQFTNLMSWNDAWELFKAPFRDKRELEDLANAIKPVRNDRAHFRHVPPRELQRCVIACDDLLAHLAKLGEPSVRGGAL